MNGFQYDFSHATLSFSQSSIHQVTMLKRLKSSHQSQRLQKRKRLSLPTEPDWNPYAVSGLGISHLQEDVDQDQALRQSGGVAASLDAYRGLHTTAQAYGTEPFRQPPQQLIVGGDPRELYATQTEELPDHLITYDHTSTQESPSNWPHNTALMEPEGQIFNYWREQHAYPPAFHPPDAASTSYEYERMQARINRVKSLPWHGRVRGRSPVWWEALPPVAEESDEVPQPPASLHDMLQSILHAETDVHADRQPTLDATDLTASVGMREECGNSNVTSRTPAASQLKSLHEVEPDDHDAMLVIKDRKPSNKKWYRVRRKPEHSFKVLGTSVDEEHLPPHLRQTLSEYNRERLAGRLTRMCRDEVPAKQDLATENGSGQGSMMRALVSVHGTWIEVRNDNDHSEERGRRRERGPRQSFAA